MKKRNDEFSYSSLKQSVNFSRENLKMVKKKPRFEYLYENSSILNKKLDLIRAKNYYNQQERMIPNINQKSKDIKRPKELFHKRLYNSYSEIPIDKSKKEKSKKERKANIKKSDKEKNLKKEEIKEKNNNDSINLQKEENKNKTINYEDNLYIMDNKSKNEEFKKFYNYTPNMKSRNVNFLFKPKINANSKKIASKLQIKSKDRLTELSLREKENLKIIFDKREMEKTMNLKLKNEKKMFILNNYTYRPNVKNNKRKWIDKLYEKGMNSIKKKEEEIKKEKILNEQEYLKYTYTPKINHYNSYFNHYNSKDAYLNSTNRPSDNTELKNHSYNNLNIKIYKLNKSNIYERNINWKKLIEKKREELRKKATNENSLTIDKKDLNQKQNNEIMSTDVSFIAKNYIEYESFLDKYNYKIIKKNLEKINYRKRNIPPKQVYAKKLVVEFVSECDSNCPTNAGTVKFYCDKRPVNEISKNRDKLKISDFFQNNNNNKSKKFKSYSEEYILNSKQNKRNLSSNTKPINKKNYINNLSFFKAVNNILNKIE